MKKGTLKVPQYGMIVKDQLYCLRMIQTVYIAMANNYVIYYCIFIGMIRHTAWPIHIHQSSMITGQTIIKLFDTRYAQNYILNEDGLYVDSVKLTVGLLQKLNECKYENKKCLPLK